uniref:EGF-like domain-containing protein n=1 Tax=Knipowitschia caucasica TaxID=637954 RepID=A0AAV2MEH8_KNICA
MDGPEVQVLDILSLRDTAQTSVAVEKLWSGLSVLSDVYLVSTVTLPQKLGGVLFGLYDRDDHNKILEVALMGKVNKVLVRYSKADGRLHTLNLQNAPLADGRSHSLVLRLGGLRRRSLSAELYVDCRLADSAASLPPLGTSQRNSDTVELRHGEKTYARVQGAVQYLSLQLGGSVAKAGALADCPFQDSTTAAGSDVGAILGDHLKALIGQLIIFNQVLGELRLDIREQVKEMSLIRNTILECQVCGFHEPRSRCSPNPCFKGVACVESLQFPGFTCGSCPSGFHGNGTHCEDEDECSVWPCHGHSLCVNSVGGFSCSPCPLGLWGAPVSGSGLSFAKKHRQECSDIDECLEQPEVCTTNSVCVNTVGSYKCGGCRPGFLGNQTAGCFARTSCSGLTFNPCDANAQCRVERSGAITCACNVGWAGNGNTCGQDSDIDGFPDRSLPCQDTDRHCRQVSQSEGSRSPW